MNADELAGLPIGARIQAIRERRGKSRPVTANLVGRSAQWLKDVERGRRLPPRWDMLVSLADVLHVDITTLTGSAPIAADLQRREGHPVVADLREAIESTPLQLPDGPEPDVQALLQRAADAWHRWHTSHAPRTAAGALLPQIVRDGRRAVRVTSGKERRTAHMALTSAYALAEQVLAWVSDSALLWLAADRCMNSAQEADRPEPVAGAGCWATSGEPPAERKTPTGSPSTPRTCWSHTWPTAPTTHEPCGDRCSCTQPSPLPAWGKRATRCTRWIEARRCPGGFGPTTHIRGPCSGLRTRS